MDVINVSPDGELSMPYQLGKCTIPTLTDVVGFGIILKGDVHILYRLRIHVRLRMHDCACEDGE